MPDYFDTAARQRTERAFATLTGRRWLFGLLYMAEGAPMGFIWWALPTILTGRGLDLATVTALSALLTLPWVFKFLVGPLVDLSIRRGHRLRSWITVCQLGMGLALLPLIGLDWTVDYDLLVLVLFAHACLAATQDVAIDTLAIRSVPPEELAQINGWMQTGMMVGRASVAAGAVALAAAGLETLIVLLLVVLIWLPLLVLHLARPPEHGADTPPAARRFSLLLLLAWPVLPGIWIALTAGAGFEFFTVTAGPLLQELGGTVRHTSLLFGVVAPVGLALGALAGGRYAACYGVRNGMFTGMALVALAVSGFGLVRRTGSISDPFLWLLPLAVIYLATGFLICVSYTLLMRMARGGYAATRFSLFMSATNGCEAWASFVGGRLAAPLGHTGAMLTLVAASALALPALLWPRLLQGSKDDDSSQAEAR